jgi:hypothetical protein
VQGRLFRRGEAHEVQPETGLAAAAGADNDRRGTRRQSTANASVQIINTT